MATAFYRIGTVAVTQGSKVVTGTGTNWNTGAIKPLVGDVFIFNNKIYEIEHIISDTEIRLYRNFEDATASAQTYVIMRNASLNISARIAAQVAQVVNQKQIMIDEFHEFLTNNTDPTVPLTDTLGNTINVIPIPMLNKDYVAKVGGIDAAVTKAVADINKAFDDLEYPLMQENQAEAIKDANKNLFAASGMVHNGNHRGTDSNYQAINEGMFTRGGAPAINVANSIYLGVIAGSLKKGSSKTDYPVTHIAGVVSNYKTGINLYQNENTILLPPAPDGTVIYDSTGDARGTGKANLNLLTEVDPKYGDIPSGPDAHNEAVARAFEGMCPNGDQRTTDLSDWTTQGDLTAITGSVLTVGSSKDASSEAKPNITFTSGVHYEISFYVPATGNKDLRANYPDGTNEILADAGYYTKVVTANGTNPIRFNFIGGAAAGTATVSNITIRKATEEVVTDRVDMFGLEQFDMVMKDGEIFDMVQSQSTTFGTSGVPTVVSTRPDSFFAVYAGQQNIVKGRCVRWPDLNRAQKRHIAKYMKERLYLNEEGNVTFSTIRQKSFAGAGNGDWRNIDSSGNAVGMGGDTTRLVRHFVGTGKYVKPQGQKDIAPNDIDGYPIYDANPTYPAYSDGGVFSAYKASNAGDDSAAYKGRCFFYVLGTVSRLNQGANHPLNESGASRVQNSDGTLPDKWFTNNGISAGIRTRAECFGVKNEGRGNIAGTSARSGRPDGRLFDAIYADGLGGVVDRRLSAWDMGSPEESAKAWEKVKNGTYRGLEKLVWTKVLGEQTISSVGTSGGGRYIKFGQGAALNNAKTIGEYDKRYSFGYNATQDKIIYIAALQGDASGDTVYFSESELVRDLPDSYSTGGVDINPHNASVGDVIWFVVGYELETSVSGNFTMTDVVGPPASIIKVDTLKNGWQGSWVNFVDNPPLSRKCVNTGSSIGAITTVDDGATWAVSGSASFTAATNTVNWSSFTDDPKRVGIFTYKAFAKQTKPSTNKPVLNGEAGVGAVMQTDSYHSQWGCLLTESLIGKVAKGTDTSPAKAHGNLSVEELTLWLTEGYIHVNPQYPVKHVPVSLTAPTNNSPAVKALPYQISDNGQCSIGVQANELTWDTPTFTEVSSNASTTYVNGGLYRLTALEFGKFQGMYVRCVSNYTGAASYIAAQRVFSEDLDIIDPSGGGLRFVNMVSAVGWGDDSAMKITDSGSDTFKDLNGNTNLSVVHELALPIGWTKNRARVSTQVSGVDL